MRAADAYRARRREEEDCPLVAELEHPLIAQLKLKRSARLLMATSPEEPTSVRSGTVGRLRAVLAQESCMHGQ